MDGCKIFFCICFLIIALIGAIGLCSLIGSRVMSAEEVGYAEYRCSLLKSDYKVSYFYGFPTNVECK